MHSFEHESVDNGIVRITDDTNVCEYLIIGSERALLIDSGYGIGDLRGYIEQLLDVPYDVICTHGHVDHASGAGQFDTVYLHPSDYGIFCRKTTIEERRSSLRYQRKEWAEHLSDEDFIPMRDKPFSPLADGSVFDLGDVRVLMVHVPGHTQGIMVPIVLERRTALLGDACGVSTLLLFPEASTVRAYQKSLKRLQTYEPLFDRVLRQHGTFESGIDIIANNIQLCEEVLNCRDDAQPYEYRGIKGRLARAIEVKTRMRVDGGEGNLAYLPNRVE